MQVGVHCLVNERSVSITEIAREVEGRGFDSLWVGEHSHMPIDTRFKYGGPIPDALTRFPDPLITLAAAATVTENLRLGTGVLLVAEHNPIHLAKQLATLDQLSGGRLDIGVGLGWNRLEAKNHGIEPDSRDAHFREKIEAIKQLWTEDVSSYHGRHVSITDSWCRPKPYQQPHPRIWIGGGPTDKVFAHVLDFADGWCPTAQSFTEPFARTLERFQLAAEKHGRPWSSLAVDVMDLGHVVDDLSKPTPTKRAEQWLEWSRLGVQRVIVGVPVAEPAHLKSALSELEAALNHFNENTTT